MVFIIWHGVLCHGNIYIKDRKVVPSGIMGSGTMKRITSKSGFI